jgi:hypothetical protein
MGEDWATGNPALGPKMWVSQSPIAAGAALEEELLDGAVPEEKSARPSGIDPRSDGGGGPWSEGVPRSHLFKAFVTGAAACQALLSMPLYSCWFREAWCAPVIRACAARPAGGPPGPMNRAMPAILDPQIPASVATSLPMVALAEGISLIADAV